VIFTQPVFLLFFVTVFAVFWLARGHRFKKLWLLAASYVFYGAWDWRFLSLMAVTTLIDYAAGLALGGERDPARRRAWLYASLAGNLGLLGFFKYFNFFVGSAAALLGLPPDDRALAIVLPVGISFYTFQTMSYTIDVYREELAPVPSLVDFALFVSFFPQLVAGPIVRAADFLPQLVRPPRFAGVDLRGCLLLFLTGFVKKSCIADHLAAVVDPVFAAPGAFTAASVWIAVLFYAAQIYCDFSGYTDMAIACAGLLGYRLTPNFDSPYLAASVAEFWRRWHISLSTWLRDYLYRPLGGNRGGRLATHRNLLLTMVLGGLWHGAAWTFVAWGALHGIALSLHREWARRRVGRSRPLPGGRPAAVALTFLWVCVCWIFFRAGSFADAAVLCRSFLLFQSTGTRALDPALFLGFAALALLHAWSRHGAPERLLRAVPAWAFAPCYGAATALALAFVPLRTDPFIYFQF